MDASLTPIQGVSLERYAELGAEVTGCAQDPEACARVAESRGVARADWEAAHRGWIARMQDPALMGRVAMAYMPLYQAALARLQGTADCSFEDYVALSGALKALGPQGFAACYRMDEATWTQLAGAWNGRIPTDPRCAMFGLQVEQEAQRIAQGGAPRPISVSRTPGQAGQPAAQAAQPQGGPAAPMAQPPQVQAGGAPGGIGPGESVLVQWSDGNRYPARCTQVAPGHLCVAFHDGRQLWVPDAAITRPV